MSKTTTNHPRFFVVVDEFAKELTDKARPSRDRRHSYTVREPLVTYSFDIDEQGNDIVVCDGLALLENGEVDMDEYTEHMDTLYRSRKVSTEVIECETRREMNEKAEILKRKMGRRGRVTTRKVLPGYDSDLAAINKALSTMGKTHKPRVHA